MENLQGGLPIDDNNPDVSIPDVVGLETLQERTKGDEPFVEELQEKLRAFRPSVLCPESGEIPSP